MNDHTRGFLLTLGGVLVLCPDTLLVRLVQADTFTLLFWRSLLMGLGLLLCVRLLSGPSIYRQTMALGTTGLLVTVLFGSNNVGFILALSHTTVAKTLFILASMPLLAALLSRLVLGERTATRTWWAMAAVGLGFAVILRGSISEGALLGDALALLTAFGLAASFVLLRRHRELNLMPAIGGGSLLAAFAALPFADTLQVPPGDVPWLLLMGLLVGPLSFALITLGPKYIPAAEVSLLMLLEAVVGPVLVWAVLAETPRPETLAGGLIVITALLAHSVAGLRAAAIGPRTVEPAR